MMAQEDVTKMLEFSPAVMRDWALRIASDREITGLTLRYEILPDGMVLDAVGQTWARWKHGSHRTVTMHCGKEVYEQTFVKRDNTWEEVKENT
jgi:hypothetical protein